MEFKLCSCLIVSQTNPSAQVQPSLFLGNSSFFFFKKTLVIDWNLFLGIQKSVSQSAVQYAVRADAANMSAFPLEYSTATKITFLSSHRRVPFQASAEVEMRSFLFCDVRQGTLLVGYRRFGTLDNGTAETSVTNYQPTLRNIPEERRPQLPPPLQSFLLLTEIAPLNYH